MTRIPALVEKLNYWYNEDMSHQYVGLRFQDEPMFAGEVIDHNSHVWDDNDDTGMELPGLCVLSQDAADHAYLYDWMKHWAVVGYDDIEYGQDYGEHIAKNPVVLEVLK